MELALDELKNAAALRALDFVQDGFLLGLGSGSTAEFALHHLASRIANGLRILAVPTSKRTARLARQLHIPLTTLQRHPRLHLTIDGADQVFLPSLTSIKGLGGALLREKLVALASHSHILIVDHTKLVPSLPSPGSPGSPRLHSPIPVEIVPFAWTNTCAALASLGSIPSRRLRPDRRPFITDSGNYLIDCIFPLIHGPADLADLAPSIKSITGVVEHGIFTGITSRLVVAYPHHFDIFEAGPPPYQLPLDPPPLLT